MDCFIARLLSDQEKSGLAGDHVIYTSGILVRSGLFNFIIWPSWLRNDVHNLPTDGGRLRHHLIHPPQFLPRL